MCLAGVVPDFTTEPRQPTYYPTPLDHPNILTLMEVKKQPFLRCSPLWLPSQFCATFISISLCTPLKKPDTFFSMVSNEAALFLCINHVFISIYLSIGFNFFDLGSTHFQKLLMPLLVCTLLEFSILAFKYINQRKLTLCFKYIG